MAASIEDVTKWGWFKKYRTMFQDNIDSMAEYEERAAIFERIDIPRNHYYNVINDFRSNPGKKEHPYHIPFEFLTKAIVGMSEKCPKKYDIPKEWAKDLGGTFLSPKDKEELRAILHESAPDPMKVLSVLQKIIGEE